jgi:monoamine oxidase
VRVDSDVIVIGAGAAGLAAARSLVHREIRVTVLEARDRDGGRVLSQPIAGMSAPAELGAEFIHGPAKETRELLRDAGIETKDTGGELWVCGADGDVRRMDDDDFLAAEGIFEGIRSSNGDVSVDDYLRRFEADGTMQKAAVAARMFVEGFDAADPAIASARAIADEWRSGVDFASARPRGGYGPMFDHLREECIAAGVRLQLSSIVRRITWGDGSVSVDIHGGAKDRQTVRARAAIVTLPVGVLRHRGDDTEVVFQPELPATKRTALASIEMGHAVRVVLKFRTPFWERVSDGRYRNAGFFRCVGQPFPTYWTQSPLHSQLMVAWVGGPKAAALGAAEPDERFDRALHGLEVLFGDPALVRAEFEQGFTHDWGRDPFSRGAYSYVARDMLAAPVADMLFFAGEATANDGQGGTVNGALETGERAAREAMVALGVHSKKDD